MFVMTLFGAKARFAGIIRVGIIWPGIIWSALALAGCVSAPPKVVQKPVPTYSEPVIMALPPPEAKPEPKPQPVATENMAGAPAELEAQIHEYWRTFPGRTGIAVFAIDSNWSVAKRGDEWFPQQSVSKLWVALAALDQVDRGKLKLDQMVRITRDDLAVFHQPIRARVLASGEIQESVQALLELAITKSDNTANDSLLRTIGGPEAVRDFINRKGLGKIRFGPGERQLQSGIAGMDWKQEYALGENFKLARDKLTFDHRKKSLDAYLADPVDGASPMAVVKALSELAKGSLLSPASTRMIMAMMERTTSGPNRLKAGVPLDWRFGHKTGTGQQLAGVYTGYNDIGIMTAPDGKRYAVAIFIADTTASVPARMSMMQGVARAVAAAHR
jgi:beta-lactamase class A